MIQIDANHSIANRDLAIELADNGGRNDENVTLYAASAFCKGVDFPVAIAFVSTNGGYSLIGFVEGNRGNAWESLSEMGWELTDEGRNWVESGDEEWLKDALTLKLGMEIEATVAA